MKGESLQTRAVKGKMGQEKSSNETMKMKTHEEIKFKNQSGNFSINQSMKRQIWLWLVQYIIHTFGKCIESQHFCIWRCLWISRCWLAFFSFYFRCRACAILIVVKAAIPKFFKNHLCFHKQHADTCIFLACLGRHMLFTC